MAKKCLDCNAVIPAARIVAMPDSDYCVKCADKHTEPTVGRMIYNHKTAGELFIARGKENIRRLDNEYNRTR